MVAERKAMNFPAKVDIRRCIHATFGFCCYLIFFGACQQFDKKGTDQNQDFKDPVNPALPTIIYLDSLEDYLRPQKNWIRDNSPPKTITVPQSPREEYSLQDEQSQTRTISSPQIIQRPYLKNEKGEAILDPKGNHFYLGDGGISHFATFTSDDGLSLDNITSSLLDKSGNLWFGTWGGGISKFDGISFINFTTAHGLSNNLVHCLAEDKDGNIWIGTEGGGISIYDGYSFSIKAKSDGLANDIIYGITPDQSGNMWIAAGVGGASKFDGERFTNFNQENGLPENTVIKIAEDRNGFIWFGTGSNGASRFDGKSFLHFTIEDGLVDNAINCIAKDRSGNLWFGTKGGGVSKYQESADLKKKGTFTNFTTLNGLGHDDVWDIEEDLDGNLWFATEGGGVSKFDGKSFTTYTTAQGLPKNVVYSISTDGSGNIWFGTAGGGVSLYKGPAVNNFTADLGLVKNSVYGILEDNNGNLWFGTDGGGVSKYDGKSFTNFTTEQGLPNPLIISALKDKNGQLWFGTGGGGIALFKDESDKSKNTRITTFNTANGLPNDIIYTIKEDRLGNIWIGTGGGGLVKFDWNIKPVDQASFTVFTTEHALGSNYIYSILEDSKGNLWVGTAGGGVSRFDGNAFTNFSTPQGLSNDIVWSILEDKAGYLWFATQGGGVSRFDGQSFSSFTKREGLGDDTVYDLLEDKEGNIFIGTNQGFTVIPAPVATLPFQEIHGSLEYYNTPNGYPVKDVNKGIYLDRQGNIWAGNGSDKTGLVKFNYQALRKKKTKPGIKIKNIRINEQPISWTSLQKSNLEDALSDSSKSMAYITDEVRVFGRQLSTEERKSQQKEFSKIQFSDIRRFENFPENLILPFFQNQITIDFGTDELVRPNLMEYRYILEGYNKSWSPVIKNSLATFGNISEGDYVFKVIARYIGPAEAEGKEWSEEAVYRFSVLPPWHRTWWAYLIYLIFFLAGINRINKFQKNRTIRKERDRIQQKELEQAKEIEKAYLDLKVTQAQLVQQEKLASLGQLTAGIAHEIKNPLNFVNNFSEVSIDMIEEIKEERAKGLSRESGGQESRDETLVDEILEDIKSNLVRIHQHGTRANSIVTSMLQHSREGTGIIEPTDLNALIKEYVNLCFHGMRAGKKSINVEISLDLDPEIKEVPLIKEDFTRVVINLCNNAFDAMREKVRIYNVQSTMYQDEAHNDVNYLPKLKVTTILENGQVRILFDDNGPGIPDEIKDKILQPFFTTKKGTEGTGLGLSITNDIIKAHGGELSVLSKAETGTKFIIQLPIQPK
ncbi:sensor histidine kinase [Aquiflexum lacus]|uniref:sensor histidine kinase n=1 Tax=Aquiflexum lacus TaxID=2483805 RepID=UPI001892DC65|nr:sensor histidine kinase [Aquiflexum lacus]